MIEFLVKKKFKTWLLAQKKTRVFPVKKESISPLTAFLNAKGMKNAEATLDGIKYNGRNIVYPMWAHLFVNLYNENFAPDQSLERDRHLFLLDQKSVSKRTVLR